MAGGAAPNPYGANNAQYAGQYGNSADYGIPSPEFASPSATEDAPYTDEFGWSPKPRISVDDTPDAMRVQTFPTRTMRPMAAQPPEEYYGPIDAEEAQRHSAESQNATGWPEQKAQYKIGPDPRWNPPAETRVTERMSPNNYSFVRPFDQGTKGNGARQFNGMHFSMADHRRDFPILGMQPWSHPRNTYRVDPSPWDADMYDVPPADTIGVPYQGRIQAVEVPDSGNRSYRLG